MEQLDLDLDISNYNLEDILNLFKLDVDFDETDMKRAKQIVLKTHPDKSGLDSKYFLFFSKAYKTLFSIYTFKNNTEKKSLERIYYTTEETDKEDMKRSLNKYFDTNDKLKNPKEFNNWFNTQFEKYRMQTEEDEGGYGEWLKSNEDCDEERNISMGEMQQEIERKKREVRERDLIVKKDISEMCGNIGGSLLGGTVPQEYSSGLFSNLSFQDLRQAHRESVIPVTKEDYDSRKKFKNVNEYSLYRDSQKFVPMSEQQTIEYLRNKDKITEQESSQRAFVLAKQMEEAKKRNNDFIGSIKYIDNK